MAKLITCKHCGVQIAAGAKTCPQCGGKNSKPIFKKWWFWVIIVLVIGGIGAGGSGVGSKSNSSSDNASAPAATTPAVEEKKEQPAKEEVKEDPAISYTAYSVDEMMDDLNSNALKASQKYKDQYVEITGRLSNIDSSGSYISINPQNDEWAFIGVQCYIKNDEQLNKVMDMNTDDIVTIRGKVTDVGEVLGYSMNIDSIP